MDMQARDARATQPYEPPRDTLPTVPEDLAAYAWVHTGLPRIEGDRDLESFAWASEQEIVFREGSVDELTSGLLFDLWHSDVPRIVAPEDTAVVDEREAWVLSLMDGHATVGALLESSGLPVSELLDTLCGLCARGVVELDRSYRGSRSHFSGWV